MDTNAFVRVGVRRGLRRPKKVGRGVPPRPPKPPRNRNGRGGDEEDDFLHRRRREPKEPEYVFIGIALVCFFVIIFFVGHFNRNG